MKKIKKGEKTQNEEINLGAFFLLKLLDLTLK